MRRDLQRRLEALEASKGDAGPVLVVIEPIEADGTLPAVDAFVDKANGLRWERLPDETMPDFIARVEAAVDDIPSRPLSIMLAPEEWPEPEPGRQWWEQP